MDNLLHDTTDITITLGKVEVTQTGGVLVQMSVRLELEDRNKTLIIGSYAEYLDIRTIACERLCALITRPIVESVRGGQ